MSAPAITADQQWTITTSESRLFTCDFTALLSDGEAVSAVSGTNGGVTLGTSADVAITLGTPTINASAITDDRGDSIAIGKAMQVRISAASGVAGVTYDVTFTCVTSDSNRIQQVCKLQAVLKQKAKHLLPLLLLHQLLRLLQVHQLRSTRTKMKHRHQQHRFKKLNHPANVLKIFWQ